MIEKEFLGDVALSGGSTQASIHCKRDAALLQIYADDASAHYLGPPQTRSERAANVGRL